MALARIWAFLILAGVVIGVGRWLVMGDPGAVVAISQTLPVTARLAFETALGLTGVMALWLGIMRLGQKAGLIESFARVLSPFLTRLFPGVPAGHPALGAIVMNFSANMLGLDSAATPLGLEAMRELQTLNPEPSRATDAQVMFTTINTAGLTLIPVSIMAFRAQLGAANPADIFLAALLGTVISALAAIVIVATIQRINMADPWFFVPILLITALLVGGVAGLSQLPQATISRASEVGGALLILVVVAGFVGVALWRGLNVFEVFVEGAKEGFQVAITIVPFLVAMLVAIAIFRASGAMDQLLSATAALVRSLGLDDGFVPALPTAFMKPLSGSGARGLMIETMKLYGPDSFAGRVVSTVQGSTETTFYVLAIYYGAVGVRRTRYTVPVGLVVDGIGIIAAILLGYLFYPR